MIGCIREMGLGLWINSRLLCNLRHVRDDVFSTRKFLSATTEESSGIRISVQLRDIVEMRQAITTFPHFRDAQRILFSRECLYDG